MISVLLKCDWSGRSTWPGKSVVTWDEHACLFPRSTGEYFKFGKIPTSIPYNPTWVSLYACDHLILTRSRAFMILVFPFIEVENPLKGYEIWQSCLCQPAPPDAYDKVRMRCGLRHLVEAGGGGGAGGKEQVVRVKISLKITCLKSYSKSLWRFKANFVLAIQNSW